MKNSTVNKKYSHFAVSKSTGKIITGWETVTDVPSLKHFAKIDLADMDIPLNSVSILSARTLFNMNKNPYDWANWETTQTVNVLPENENLKQVSGNGKTPVTDRKETRKKRIENLEADLKLIEAANNANRFTPVKSKVFVYGFCVANYHKDVFYQIALLRPETVSGLISDLKHLIAELKGII